MRETDSSPSSTDTSVPEETTAAHETPSSEPTRNNRLVRVQRWAQAAAAVAVVYLFAAAWILLPTTFKLEIESLAQRFLGLTGTEFSRAVLSLLFFVSAIVFVASKTIRMRLVSVLVSMLPTSDRRQVEESVYDSPSRLSNAGGNEAIAHALRRIEELQAKLDQSVNSGSDNEFRATPKKIQSLVSSISKSEVERQLSKELLTDTLDSFNKAQVQEADRLSRQRLSDAQVQSLRRLGIQVEVLGTRANRAQRLGILFAVSGLILLYLSFFTDILPSSGTEKLQTSPSLLQLVEHYIPRFSLVLLVEIVAFFFLRLYSKTLLELRYVQNETTNVELQFISMNSALSHCEKDTIAKVVEKLASTDRNSVIEKTQTTIEIEKERASAEGEVSTIKALADILHGNEKGWFWRKRE